MAATRKNQSQHRKSVSYTSAYDGNAVRKLDRIEQHPAERRRNRHRPLNLKVREGGKVAPVAVLGFLVVSLLTMLLLAYNAELVMVNDQAVALRGQLSKLKVEEAKLLTKYELAYDLQDIEEKVISSGEMIKQQSDQVYMLELVAPDEVEYHQSVGLSEKLAMGVKGLFSAIMAYF